MATGEDLRYPATEGKRPGLLAQMAQRYVLRVLDTMSVDPVVAVRFLEVNNLLKRPGVLLAPGIVWRVVRHSLVGKRPAKVDQGIPERQVAKLNYGSYPEDKDRSYDSQPQPY